jgi:hypothetical protein
VKAKKKPKRKQRRALNKKPAFLAAFKVCASLTEAAAAIGIDRGQHYEWLRKDAKYAAAFEAAKEAAAQSLEDEAVTRARVGVYEPNVYQGKFVYPREEYEIEPAKPAADWKDDGGERPETPAVMGWRDVPGAPPIGVWKKSDGLMMFLLRGFLPGKYRQQASVELTGAGGGPVELSIVERLNAARNRLAAAKNAPEQKQS